MSTQMAMTVQARSPKDLSEPEMQALYQLKARYLPARDRTASRRDYELFSRDCLASSVIIVGRTPDGDTQGFYTISEAVVSYGSHRALVLTADYGVMNEGYRRGFRFAARGSMHILARSIRHIGIPTYFFGGAFPASYIALRRMSTRVWSYCQPDLPDTTRGLFGAAAEKFCGDYWDPGRGLVHTRTVPPKNPMSPGKTALQAYQDYVRWNPHYRDGTALGVLIPVDFQTLRELAGWTVNFWQIGTLTRFLGLRGTARRAYLPGAQHSRR